MTLDADTIAVLGVVVVTLIAQLRLVSRKLDVLIPALMERSRRRNRRESSGPHKLPAAASESWNEETTDVHYLCELERERERVRRQRRPGERAPRPGTRSDKPYED